MGLSHMPRTFLCIGNRSQASAKGLAVWCLSERAEAGIFFNTKITWNTLRLSFTLQEL